MEQTDTPAKVASNAQLGPGAEACPTCGSDCNERDELVKAEREMERLRAELLREHEDHKAAIRDVEELVSAERERCAKIVDLPPGTEAWEVIGGEEG